MIHWCTDVCQHPLLQLLFNVLTLTVKTQLTVSLTFMIVGMVLTAVAVVLLFPLWHMGAFLTGGILALFACEFPLFLLYIFFSLSLHFVPLSPVGSYAVTIGMFLGIDNDYAGFFSLNGLPNSGCLWYSFGLAVGAWMTNLIGGAVGIGAFVYSYRKSSNDNSNGVIIAN